MNPSNDLTIMEILQQLTPMQRDVLMNAAQPKIDHFGEFWNAPCSRQLAIAEGLVRRGLLYQVSDSEPAFGVTDLGEQIGALALHQETSDWITDQESNLVADQAS
jgi:hypothetical protein